MLIFLAILIPTAISLLAGGLITILYYRMKLKLANVRIEALKYERDTLCNYYIKNRKVQDSNNNNVKFISYRAKEMNNSITRK